MANPRITITIREQLYEQVEIRRTARNLSQSRMIEHLIQHGLESLELEDLERRSPVIARLDRLEELIESSSEALGEALTQATEKRIVPRANEAAIRAQCVYELLAAINPHAAQLDRERIRSEAAQNLKRGATK